MNKRLQVIVNESLGEDCGWYAYVYGAGYTGDYIVDGGMRTVRIPLHLNEELRRMVHMKTKDMAMGRAITFMAMERIKLRKKNKELRGALLRSKEGGGG